MTYKNKKIEGLKEETERYHGPLAKNGVELDYIKIFPWLGLILNFFLFVIGTYKDYLGILTGISVFCIAVNLLGIGVAVIPYLFLKLKRLTYYLIALIGFTMLINLDFLGLLMVVSDGSPLGAKEIYQSPLTLFYVAPMLILFILSCILYTWHYLPKNRGKVWAFNQVKEVNRKQTWWNNFALAFGAAMLLPAFLTGYIQIVFGFLLGVLLTMTLPALMVDAVYAAIYVKKHPDSDELA